MASVTQTIPNFLGGVSNQPDDKKLPGQVTAAVNAYPDPTFGLTKRPGFKYMTQLASATTGGTAFDNNDLDKAKWFYVNRDADEKYLGCIVGNATEADAAIHVWNVAEVDGNGDYVKCAVTYNSNTRQYLNALNSYDYDFLNVRDTSIITNKTKVVTSVADNTTATYRATVRLHLVEYSALYEIKVKLLSNNTTYTATLNTRAGDTATNDADVTGFLDAKEILTALKTAIDGHSISGITTYIIGSTLEIAGTGDFTIAVEGGKAGSALSAYKDEVNSVADIAGETIHNREIKIVNLVADTGYYAKFKAEDGVSGVGVWEETRAFGVDKGLNSATMPHKLYNTAKNAFTFSVIEDTGGITGVFGTPRLVGDDDSNSHPSFKGATIQQAFFNNNRLGFLTADNVSMSKAGDYYNFYFSSAQTVTADDPIDLSCSSIREATLHGVIPTASGLLLFSQNQQFIMYAADGNLSPSTALIRGLSNYRMDTKIDPVDTGNNINFLSKTHDTAGFTRVFGMQPQGVGQMPKVVDIGRVVSEYIPATVDGLAASTQNSFIAMWGKTENKIYFYRTYSDGEKDLIQCWFNWECPGNVHYVNIDSDTMYSVVKTGTGGSARYNVLSATLTQTPEEAIIVTSTGQQVNPHMDFYAKAVSVAYDSTNDLSKCRLPYSDIAALDPVIIIAGTPTFSGVTESGFTIEPDRLTDSGIDYFTVPNKNLVSQAANVYVGYKYNYDITLPKMYYRKDPDGKLTDYTAPLTIARMKFSVGQSSVVGFKLNRKGVQAATQSFIGDGSTTAFSPDFTVKDLKDVVVKKNGAKQTLTTDYTIARHSTLTDGITVTFGTAPAAATTAANVTTPADSIEIYVDNWYTLQPTQDANYYLGDDVPLETQNLFSVPIHQRTDNYTLRVFSDSPFPLALTSMAWEGNYSPRFYRRT